MTKRFFTESSSKSNLSFSPDGINALFSLLKKDDLVLLGIILILLGDGCEDKELLIMLALLFVSDKISITDKLFGT